MLKLYYFCENLVRYASESVVCSRFGGSAVGGMAGVERCAVVGGIDTAALYE